MTVMLPGRGRFAGTLFERIRNAHAGMERKTSATTLRQSIFQNLQNILNTRHGNCQGTPGLGIVDFNDAITPTTDFYQVITNTIRDCILHYEPRISAVEVSAVMAESNTPLDLRFHVVATVNFGGIRDAMEFDMSMSTHQHFKMD
ncbi:type VI secretion system baseplate subunit TssE [Enterobacter cloacae]|uniref:type VI secretion system baseplate subunit TssE n=1 Tax=Enterobacter TaxID=547 RepID=UPI000D1D4713|nr:MULTISPECIES: type VI secretion system baseplate subunit TssE [Enterobacter]RAY65877.1 type VI secretion system baseplate subunit TssE [Enterobacter hormaechei]MBJ6386500.1 type VI secretion system baseplate subunit TssE [Enterobacter cloacae]MBJ6405616.1 type VI secretion system baseplate subunit TssE [Enterobacter cloacae]MBJ6435728.1 type VI secretion system baseplate subunit TssE [Enterobacter cloacae]MBJ6458503.1 type VI secretion system baseplate subunit TssE [Enterobacter cloacae]